MIHNQLDAIRDGVSLSPMFPGDRAPKLGPMVVAVTATGGPFHCPASVVVNRSPLHADKERTEAEPMRIRRLCQGELRSFRRTVRPRGLSLLPAHTGETEAQLGSTRREKKAEVCPIQRNVEASGGLC